MGHSAGMNQNAETTKFNLPNIGELALYAVCAAGLLYTGLFRCADGIEHPRSLTRGTPLKLGYP